MAVNLAPLHHPSQGIAFLPKSSVNVETCEVARIFRLLDKTLVPVHFEVPRKGTSSFQADLYPDTAAAVPAQTAADYFSGKNSNPRMLKMDTKAVVDPAPYEPYEPVRSGPRPAEAPKPRASMDSPVAPKAGGGDSEGEALRKRVAEPEAKLRAAVASTGPAPAPACCAVEVKLGRKQFHADCDYIDCVQCNVSDADMAVFAARSKTGEFSRVKEMILGGNQIGNAAAKSIAAAMNDISSLQSLSLANNRIGDAGAKAIAEALKENSSLQKLYLGTNQIGDAGTKAIAAALKENSSLQYLSLSSNQISDDGAKSIAAAIKENSSLNGLDLSFNEIGDHGAQSIASALEENSSLQDLSLYKNRIGDDGAKSIAAAMHVSSSLKALSLEYNNVSVAATCHLIACIFINPNLTELKLDHDPSACVAHHAWRSADLPQPPFAALRLLDKAKGWAAVLKALKTHLDMFRDSMPPVLAAASALVVFDRFSVSVHVVQRPALLGTKLSQSWRARASVKDKVHLSNERLQLLCCGCPLSALLLCLATVVDHNGRTSILRMHVVRIMKRYLSSVARRLWSKQRVE
jgi:Leucine-rich repeat (LRR) protein